MENEKSMRIDAEPAKELFISMLTRDLRLSDAIAELVDNSVDAARVFRPNKDYDGLSVNIEFNATQFMISDNCGGITIDDAINKVFRFGKDNNVATIPFSIGQFGIGMKRALFKIGKYFTIESTTESSRFVVEVDVEKWREEKGWNFEFKKFDAKSKYSLQECGTKITITKLNEDVVGIFKANDFRDKLIEGISKQHTYNVNRKLLISINQQQLKSKDFELISTSILKHGVFRHTYEVETSKNNIKVNVRIIIGLSVKDLSNGGWYIFCNDRLIEHDKSEKTGWGAKNKSKNTTTLPVWHNQYDRFRGFVFFEAEDSKALPWNTSKNGIDVDATLYREVLKKMIEMARPAVDFLNKIHNETRKQREINKGNDIKEKVEEEKIFLTLLGNEQVQTLQVSQILQTTKVNTNFEYNIEIYRITTSVNRNSETQHSEYSETKTITTQTINSNQISLNFNDDTRQKSTQEEKQTISFSVEKKKAQKAMRSLNAATYEIVGTKIFNYYYDKELSRIIEN